MIYFTEDILKELEKRGVNYEKILDYNYNALQDGVAIIAEKPCFKNHFFSEDKWVEIVNKDQKLNKLLFGSFVPFKNFDGLKNSVNEYIKRYRSKEAINEIFYILDYLHCDNDNMQSDDWDTKCLACANYGVNTYISEMKKLFKENNIEYDYNAFMIDQLREYYVCLIEQNWCNRCLMKELLTNL